MFWNPEILDKAVKMRRTRQPIRKPQAIAVPAPDTRGRLLVTILMVVTFCLLAMRLAFGAVEPVKVQLPAKAVSVKAGTTVTVPVTIKVDKGWHIFAAKPLVENVKAANLTLTSPTGLKIAAPAMPAARKIRVESLSADANVYEDVVKLKVQIAADKAAAAGPRTVEGVFAYQACNDSQCLLPKKAKFSIPVVVVR